MNDDLARALEEFRKVLALPTVGQPHRDAELTELRRLVQAYPDEAQVIIREVTGGA